MCNFKFVLYRIVSWSYHDHIIPYRIIYHVIYRIICHIKYHTIPYQTMPCHAMPCHWYHIIPYIILFVLPKYLQHRERCGKCIISNENIWFMKNGIKYFSIHQQSLRWPYSSAIVEMATWYCNKKLTSHFRPMTVHDDVIKWMHFPRYWPFVRGPVTDEFPSLRPVTRSFDVSLICSWTNVWINNRDADDLRRNRAHCDVTVISEKVGHWSERSMELLIDPYIIQYT